MHFRGARRWVLPALVIAVSAGCGGSASTPELSTAKTPPDLQAFLRLPVATPSSCPSAPGAAAGRRSPWVGHVDVSVFVTDKADATTRRALHEALVAEPNVARVYTETRQQAVAEFERLYTCSAQVPRSALRASYRLVLGHITVPQRDALVRRIYRLPGVGSVSCDPSSPCTNVRR